MGLREGVLTSPGQPPVSGNPPHWRLTTFANAGDVPTDGRLTSPVPSALALCVSPSPASITPRTNSPGTHSGWRPSPRPLTFSTKFPPAIAPLHTGCQAGLARQTSFRVRNSKAHLSGDASSGGLTVPDVRLLALPLLRDPGAEEQSPRREQGGSHPLLPSKPAGTTATSMATPGDWGRCPDGTYTEQEPHLKKDLCPEWPKAVREQIKQTFGKTLKHKDGHRGRQDSTAPGSTPVQDQTAPPPPPRQTIRITQSYSRLTRG